MKRFSRSEAREVDRRASEDIGIPPILLMENAGAGAARIALGMLKNQGLQGDTAAVVCVAGTGGNGGDALVVARHVRVAGIPVRILLFRAPESAQPGPETRLHEGIVRRMGLPVATLTSSEDVAGAVASLRRGSLVIDGLFGSGLARPVAGAAATLIDAMNASRRPILSLDLPSGLDCDDGRPRGACVRAAVTVTFGALKLGFANPASAAFTGRVRVVGIGAPLD